MKRTHKVLDLHYTPSEGQDCFSGTEQECYDFIETQSPHFMYKVVHQTKEDMQAENLIDVLRLIRRKKKGIDCTEAESAEIKGFVKERIIQVETMDVSIIEDIQMYFPQEYGEAIDEQNVDNKVLADVSKRFNSVDEALLFLTQNNIPTMTGAEMIKKMSNEQIVKFAEFFYFM